MRMKSAILASAALAAAAAALPASAQTKWNLAAAYPPGNYHTENLVWFADEVKKATGGKLEITVHPGASLFKAPEIKRAVGTGNYRINAWIKNDAGAFQNAGEFFLTGGASPQPQLIEFEYTQGDGSGNGRLIARKGGAQQFDTLATLDNDTWPLGMVRLGFVQNAQDLAVANGPIAIDEFESYR